MDENKIGKFIADLRKEKKMTQKNLAEQLHITDKAVSKWERGLSCPDITLLSSIADILGVTTNELLNGRRNETATSKYIEETIDNALVYAAKSAKRNMMTLQNAMACSFSILLLLGILACSICDMAISGTFTWSLYPISSILFVWLVFVPLIKLGNRGILWSLAIFCILLIPYLYVISKIVCNNLIMPIGVRISLVSIIYLWCVYWIFKRLNARKIMAAALSLLLAIPLCIVINIILAKILSIPYFDIWDILLFAVIIVIAITLFMIDLKKHNY